MERHAYNPTTLNTGANQHMNTQSDNIAELAVALAKAQAEMGGVHKDAANPYFKSSYATLAAVWETVKPALTKNGLSIVQLPGSNERGYFVQTMLMHASGQWIRSCTYMKPAKEDPQGIGSLISYARRYALMAMVMACPDDDDGEAAMGRSTSPAETPKPQNKGKGVTSTEKPPKSPQKHENTQVNKLALMLADIEATPQEFLEAMKQRKAIPAAASNFFAMKEATAENFITDFELVKKAMLEWKAIHKKA